MRIFKFFVIICAVLVLNENLVAQHSEKVEFMKRNNQLEYAMSNFESQSVIDKNQTSYMVFKENTLIPIDNTSQSGLTKGEAMVIGGIAGFLVVSGLSLATCSGGDYGVCAYLAPIVGLAVGIPVGVFVGASAHKKK
ncbi:MAG: hypothetical protein HKN75_10210 [Bacteroidia bacterium]|nr:hypothetical protein [Bacteroidia bacterium]